MAASIAGPGNPPQVNASTLGNSLSYVRSYKTKCTKKTSSAYLPSSSGSPEAAGGSGSESPANGGSSEQPGGSGDSTSPAEGGGNPSSPDYTGPSESSSGTSGANGNPNPQSPTAGNGLGQLPATASSPPVCGPQSTVTVTAQQTVTVTQTAQAADSAGAGDTLPTSALGGSPLYAASTGLGTVSSNAASNGLEGGEAGSASLPGAPVEKVAISRVSKIRTRTKCAKGTASNTGITAAPSDIALPSSSPSTPISSTSAQSESKSSASSSATDNSSSGPYTSNSGNEDSISQSAASKGETSGSNSSGSGSPTSNIGTGNPGSHSSINNTTSGTSMSGSSTVGAPYNSGNSTLGNPSPSRATGRPLSSSLIAPTSISNFTNGSASSLNGQFWAGATLGTLIRMEAIPERKFYDFDGTTEKDPFITLGDAGVNAVRVEGMRGQCLGPTNFVNNGSTLGEELTFTLDWGCLDIQVQTAQRGVEQGMRVVLTINQGFNIPEGMESYSYNQMVGEVQKETKRQLQPFLDANIVPDVILFENEGSDGFLFKDTTTGHVRGHKDGKVSKEQLDKELCGLVPTGIFDSAYAQYAGYLKAEVAACNEIIKSAGFDTDAVRYGLHSHGQYVQWKESVVHGPNQANDQELKDSSGKICDNSVIPSGLLAQNTSQLLTIMGFSAYLDPMTPTDINSQTSELALLDRLNATLIQLQGYAEAYGKYESGPFAGQYKLQSLGVEYGTSYTYDQIPQEQEMTNLMWSTVQKFSNLLGILWYEPWYCHADWEGGHATLCHNIDSKGVSGEAPTNTLTTWGEAARSPWKK